MFVFFFVNKFKIISNLCFYCFVFTFFFFGSFKVLLNEIDFEMKLIKNFLTKALKNWNLKKRIPHNDEEIIQKINLMKFYRKIWGENLCIILKLVLRSILKYFFFWKIGSQISQKSFQIFPYCLYCIVFLK